MKKLLRMKDLILLTCAMILLGIINFTTSSKILIQINGYGMLCLLGILLIKIAFTIIFHKANITNQNVKEYITEKLCGDGKKIQQNEQYQNKMEKIKKRYQKEHNKVLFRIVGIVFIGVIILYKRNKESIIHSYDSVCHQCGVGTRSHNQG